VRGGAGLRGGAGPNYAESAGELSLFFSYFIFQKPFKRDFESI